MPQNEAILTSVVAAQVPCRNLGGNNLFKPAIYKLTFENGKYIGVQKIGTFGRKSIAEST